MRARSSAAVPPDPTLACRRASRDPVLAHQHQEEALQHGRPRARLTVASSASAYEAKKRSAMPAAAAPKRPPNPMLDRRRTCRRSQQRPSACRPRRRRSLDVDRRAPTRVVPPRRRPPRRHATPRGCPLHRSDRAASREEKKWSNRPCCLWDARRGPSYDRCLRGRLYMQRPEELRQGLGRVLAAGDRPAVQRHALYPRHDRPVFGERSEGAPSRTGTGIGRGRRAARNGSHWRSLNW